MKKLLALILALVMVFSLVACGGESEEEYEDDAQEYEEEYEDDAQEYEEEYEDQEYEEEEDVPMTNAIEDADIDPDAPVTDEQFEAVQGLYAALVEVHDQVYDVFTEEEILANEELANLLAQAREVILQMGEISRENLTQQQALDLFNAMAKLGDGLDMLVQSKNPS